MKRSLKFLVALAPVMALASSTLVAQAGTPVIAILSFDNNSIGKDAKDFDGIGKGVMDLLITDLAASGKVRVVDRDRIQQILAEQKLTSEKQIDGETAVRLGKLLGACYSVYGGFMRDLTGGNVITAHTTSNETGQIQNPEKVQNKGDDVMKLIADLSAKLVSDMKLTSCGGGTRSASASPTQQAGTPAASAKVEQYAKPLSDTEKKQLDDVKLDARGMLLYSRALDAIDHKDKAKARDLLAQVNAKVAPKHFAPAENQLKSLGTSGD